MSDAAAFDLSVHPDVVLDADALRRAAARAAGVREADVRGVRVLRRAIDARHGKVRMHLRVALVLPGMTEPAAIEPVALPSLGGAPRVAIVGAGPAGMFCAWQLAQHGLRSIVLERGKPVRARRHDLAALTRRGVIDPDSNYCFGEGGAGTFSDGKLYTRADKRGAPESVLRAFVGYGAPPEILVDARPHIGTNRLPRVIESMREHLGSAGIELSFSRRVVDLRLRDGRVCGVEVAGGDVIDADAVVLAVGHSARDIFELMARSGVMIAFKPFAIGVRVEHEQAFVDRLQYGALAGHPALGSAAYRVVEQACGRGVFSFCMCPGGFIVPAATSPQEHVVNGWSPSSRRGRYANSGFVTEIDENVLVSFGFSPTDPLAGLALQRSLERASYDAGGGAFVAPAQRLDDFLARRQSTELPSCSYPRGLAPVELDGVLGSLGEPLRVALRAIDRRMPGFAGPTGVGVALESRTSSPVRIVRGDDGQSPSHPRLFPCGEGAGYAGGIMSAALDGIRTADAVAATLGVRSR